ncbi:hypothetical protein, conserved [Trypanosoma brucei gambiense DAL972]|uniref:Pseudouridine synthase I TruA alpha/beta domain-containing protein n=1 Tax=Trypanosoma brucei gambiense (strain MHOM/CI/86/DAL972) TaxID=679716 RepID=D0A1W0_TRYB9|nr:hypothetical protein, conserved [Trypanosoma brucei gambiense DAL972]CBH15253.1 hypothetical protein, conserved [Trypanosoma brucei gambiense DAL972]|eukprot:XP_011777518.1 hypothetical protein, conserved [Trypanosoma brucei gambiense DAL972]
MSCAGSTNGADACSAVASNYSACDVRSSKRPKRKVAIIFGYIGERYCGLQWNHLPNYPTVEEELLRALRRADMISEENYAQQKVQQKLNWERASRTDKGVHALRNVFSLNVMLPYAKDSTSEFDVGEARRLLTEALPSDIVVYEIIPVTRSFNAYMMCGSRKYEYYLPTFAFMNSEEYSNIYFPPSLAPSRPTLEEVGFLGTKTAGGAATNANGNGNDATAGSKRQRLCEKEGGSSNGEVTACCTEQNNLEGNTSQTCQRSDTIDDTGGGNNNGGDSPQKFHDGLFEKMLVFHTIPESAMQVVARYRVTPQRLEHARNIFKLFEGTHSYHNFTPGGKASDPSSARYITSVTVSEPFVVDPSDDAMLSALQLWAPSRYYSPDDERLVSGEVKDDDEVEQERERMRERMIRIYGTPAAEGTGDINRNMGDRNRVGLEVVRIELSGQSFLFNQIRKMIGTVASMCAAGLPPDYLRDHFLNKAVRCGTPMVPANGLFLTYLDFQRYNYRLDRIQLEGENGKGKGGIYVDRVDEQAVETFRRKIVAVVLRNEMATDAIGRWMRSLRHVMRLACNIELP